MSELQQPVFPADLAAVLGIKIKTLARMIKSGSLPAFDVVLSQKSRYWHRSTLVNKKIIL